MDQIPSDKAEKFSVLGRTLAWFTSPENSKYITLVLIITCIGLFFLDFTYKKYGHFDIEKYKGFYGFYGFVMFTGLILVAKALRFFINQSEDYYGDKAVDNEEYPENQLEKVEHRDV